MNQCNTDTDNNSFYDETTVDDSSSFPGYYPRCPYMPSPCPGCPYAPQPWYPAPYTPYPYWPPQPWYTVTGSGSGSPIISWQS